MKSDPKRGSRRLVLASSMLAAAIVVPMIGGASAAPLASTPFHVKAQNADESARFAIKPLLEAKKTPAPEPTAPGTTPPVTNPSPAPTAEPTAPPVTTPPPFNSTTVFYHNGSVPATGNGVVESKSSSTNWASSNIATNVTGQPATLDRSNQLAFTIRTVRLTDRSIRLTVPKLEPGTYSFSLFGNSDQLTTWKVSTAGAEPQSYSFATASWSKASIQFTTDSLSTREITVDVNMPKFAQYGDVVYWDDVTLTRIG